MLQSWSFLLSFITAPFWVVILYLICLLPLQADRQFSFCCSLSGKVHLIIYLFTSFLFLSFSPSVGCSFSQLLKYPRFLFLFSCFFHRHFPPFPYSATTSTTIVCNFNRCLLLFCHRHRHRVNHQQVLFLLQKSVFSGPFSGNSQASAASFPLFCCYFN